MGRLFLFTLIMASGLSLLIAPWISGVAYVLNSLLQPQYLWPWVFQGLPIFRITAGLAIFGSFLALVQNTVDSKIFKNRQNFMLIFMWVWMHLSHLLTPFQGEAVSVSPATVLSTLDSILIMYFVLLPLFNNEKALKCVCYTFILVGAYYTYWANSAYLYEEWYRFVNNRLTGPSRSPYGDANVLSTLIVMCLPFIILLFFRVEKRFSKVLIVLLVPLAWHAIVLFSSRAALLGLVFSLLLVAYVIRSKKVNVILACAFIIFLVYEGGMLVNRTTETIEMTQVESEAPLNPRLVSWEAALRLIPEYPVFGAGVQMFEAAARQNLPGMTPHVAHNTFLNFSVNTGLITGLMFLGLIYISWRRLKQAILMDVSFADFNYYATISSSISLMGFFVCSIFLDLIIYEPFYIALLINIIAFHRLSVRVEMSKA